jgi:hypothetical protein
MDVLRSGFANMATEGGCGAIPVVNPKGALQPRIFNACQPPSGPPNASSPNQWVFQMSNEWHKSSFAKDRAGERDSRRVNLSAGRQSNERITCLSSARRLLPLALRTFRQLSYSQA